MPVRLAAGIAAARGAYLGRFGSASVPFPTSGRIASSRSSVLRPPTFSDRRPGRNRRIEDKAHLTPTRVAARFVTSLGDALSEKERAIFLSSDCSEPDAHRYYSHNRNRTKEYYKVYLLLNCHLEPVVRNLTQA